MKLLLKIEEIGQLALGAFFFSQLGLSWWWFIGLFFVPDIGIVGYLFGSKTGAVGYNLFHHKGLAIALFLIGIYMRDQVIQLCGIMLFAHAAFDRIFGFGLKYATGFKQTHLGSIGN